MNHDRLASRIVWCGITLALCAQPVSGGHDTIGPVADRAPFEQAWTDAYRGWTSAQYYGGCGYPDYGVYRPADDYRPMGFQASSADNPAQRPDLLPPQFEQNAATQAPAAEEPFAPIGTGVAVRESEVAEVLSGQASSHRRTADREIWSLATGYDSAYDAAMVDDQQDGRDLVVQGAESLALFWQFCRSEVARRTSETELSQTARRLRLLTTTTLEQVWQASERGGPMGGGARQASVMGRRPSPSLEADSSSETAVDASVLLRAADALQEAGSVLSGLREQLRAWAGHEEIAFVAEIER